MHVFDRRQQKLGGVKCARMVWRVLPLLALLASPLLALLASPRLIARGLLVYTHTSTHIYSYAPIHTPSRIHLNALTHTHSHTHMRAARLTQALRHGGCTRTRHVCQKHSTRRRHVCEKDSTRRRHVCGECLVVCCHAFRCAVITE